MNAFKKILVIFTGLVLIITGASTAVVMAQGEEDILTGDGMYAAADDALADVTGLTATAGAGKVTLKWNPVPQATGYIIFYGTESVGSGETYNLPEKEINNVTTYNVTGLTGGTKYYFSVAAMNDTALSASYGTEVSATPTGSALAPAIQAAEALNSTHVRVLFATDMNFGPNLQNEVTIVKEFDDTELEVVSVDTSNSKILDVTTEEQEAGVSYLVTYKSGSINLSRSFLGSANAATSDEFKVLSAQAVSATEIEVTFSEAVTLGSDPINEIAIVETEDNSKFLTVSDVRINNSDPAKILVVTDEQSAVEYTAVFTGVTNATGSLLSDENSTFELGGFGFDGGDTTPPEEVSSLRAQLTDVALAAVTVTWGASPNTAQDLANYLVYFSEDKGVTYRLLSTLDSNTLTLDQSGLPESEVYTFKVTAKDQAGNESEGKTVSLPGTGMPGVLALVFSSLAGGRFLTRRNKK